MNCFPFSAPKGCLACFQRDGGEPVPGCSGNDDARADYCYQPPANYLCYLGQNQGTGGYGLCQGDCDDDSDCKDGLLCEQRSGLTPIPGCVGEGLTGTDYCRYPESKEPSSSPTNFSPTKMPTPGPTKSPLPPTVPPTKNPTNLPTTVAPTVSNKPFEFLGENPDGSYPLGECQGDCDSDDQCLVSLSSKTSQYFQILYTSLR